jgi:hypothetical protein
MNRTFDDEDSAELNKPMETADPAARQAWVKPVLERLSLKEALGANVALSNDATMSGGS